MNHPSSFTDRLVLAVVGVFFGAILGAVISVMMIVLYVDARFEPTIVLIAAATTASVGLVFGYRLTRAKRRLRRVQAHIGFRVFLGLLVFGAAFVALLTVMPQQLVEEYKTLIALGFALTAFSAVLVLAAALIDATMKKR